MRLLLKVLFAGCLLLPFASQAASPGPEDVVKTFYQSYLKGNGTIPVSLSRHLDRHLIKSLNNWAACESDTKGAICPTECIKFACNYDGVWIDHYVNYFTKTGKSWPTWSSAIRAAVMKKGTTTATVKVVIGKDPDPSVTMNVSMKKEDGHWKISTVEEII